MLNSLSAPHPEPVTEAPVYGTKKGNEIFDRATQALKEFDDMDESLPPMSNNLKLKWQEDEDLLAQVPVTNGGFQYFQSILCVVCVKERERVDLPAYPALSLEAAVDQANTAGSGGWMKIGEAPMVEESTAGMERSGPSVETSVSLHPNPASRNPDGYARTLHKKSPTPRIMKRKLPTKGNLPTKDLRPKIAKGRQ